MGSTRRPAAEGLFSWAERWAPGDAELWAEWRRSLSGRQHTNALLPLQAALSGLVAHGHLENHPPSSELATDFRPDLLAVRVTYDWALTLIDRLRGAAFRSGMAHEPSASLSELEHSLTDALRASEPLLEPLLVRPPVDREAFQRCCDLFAHDLERNTFFNPPEPLEFANVGELIGSDDFVPKLQSRHGEAAEMTLVLAFLTLLRGHRYLGIADQQIRERDGLYRAHVIASAVRRELHLLTRFLLEQGAQSLSGDHQESVDRLALDVQSIATTMLDQPVPSLKPGQAYALHAEQMRNAIREARGALKVAAKTLHGLGRPERAKRVSGTVPKSPGGELWSFRFILRAFIDKASATMALACDPQRLGDVNFAKELATHFRVFGPRLIKSTRYARKEPLVGAISALRGGATIGAAVLDRATEECGLFLSHLDEALAEAAHQQAFDKREAAAALEDYLRGVREHDGELETSAGAFGLVEQQSA